MCINNSNNNMMLAIDIMDVRLYSSFSNKVNYKCLLNETKRHCISCSYQNKSYSYAYKSSARWNTLVIKIEWACHGKRLKEGYR